jgi:multidrug resistance efflux pump
VTARAAATCPPKQWPASAVKGSVLSLRSPRANAPRADSSAPDSAPAPARVASAGQIPVRAAASQPATQGATSASMKFILLLSGVQSRNKFAESATVLVTELASALQCDRVSIGFRDKYTMQVVAMSHQGLLNEQQAFLRPIAAAMEEAALQAATVALPEEGTPRIGLAHMELMTRHASTEIATVPLARNGRVYAALTLERARNKAFTREELKFLETVAVLLGPLLELKRRAQLGWLASTLMQVREARAAMTGRGRQRLLAIFIAAFALLIAAGFYPVQYRVSAPAHLEGLVQRALSAPSDGFLKLVRVRPGDEVKEGQVLVELADEELQLERRKSQGELAQLDSTLGDALGRHDRALIATTAARIEETRAQLELTESRLAHVQIKAPFDGVVIKGDLVQSVGAPLRQGDSLLVLAPSAGYRVIVDVDERDVADLSLQQGGQLTLSAFAGEEFRITVIRITPVSSTRDGRNFFEVEAKLDGVDGRLRPGLQGVAKVEVAQRPLVWVLTHTVWNWLRVAVWSLTG